MQVKRKGFLTYLALSCAIGAMAAMFGCGSNTSCSAADESNRKSECFAKSELATSGNASADAASADAGSPAASCPSAEVLQQSRLSGTVITDVTDKGTSCCYQYFYPCE